MTNKKAAISTLKRLKLKRKVRSSVFIEIDYLRRLRLMRDTFAADQTSFAKQLDIPFKRWSNYERGYPIPREMAWHLWHQLGVSVEWLWYGATGNMRKDLLDRIAVMEKQHDAEKLIEQELETKQAELAALRKKLKKHRVPDEG